MKEIDWSLYLVLDRSIVGGGRWEDVLLGAITGGVTAVQIRDKTCSTRSYIEFGKLAKKLVGGRVPFLVNDRVDVAMAVGADGVHIGRDDIPYGEARSLLGSEALIGVTVESLEDAYKAKKYDAAYLGVSSIFSTPTKTDVRHIWNLDGIAELRRKSRHTLIGIGGINSDNAGNVIRSGADGIAVVSAICVAKDPRRAAMDILLAVKRAKASRV